MRLVTRLSSAGLGGALTLGLLVAPTVTPAWAASRPVTPKVRTVPVDIPRDMPTKVRSSVGSVTRAGAGVASAPETGSAVVESEEVSAGEQDLSSFSMVGATLPSADIEAADVEVRVKAKGGSWGGWQALSAEDSGPDTDTAEAEQATKNVTSPLWVGPSDGVQARVRLGASEAAMAAGKQVELTLVDPGTSPADNATGPVASADAASGRPTIIRRSQWGADESLTCSETSSTDSVSAAVVHHTAGSNAYRTRAEAMRQIRGDYAYHTKTRGWCDIGYNFIVDKWGNIYEGRRGSIDSSRIGAHAAGFNKLTVGVTMLGNYSSITPSFATQRSVANVIAWKLSSSGRAPGSTVNYIAGAGSPRYRQGTQVTLPRIIGHRNVGYTTCPGNGGYRTLSWIRQRASAVAGGADFVRAAFRDTIGREGAENSVVAWQGELAAYGRNMMVAKLQKQSESRNREIRAAYRLVLNRAPNGTELARANQRMARGVGRHTLVVELLGGAEFYRQAGSSRAGFVNLAHRRVLERWPSTAERNRWVSLTSRGRMYVSNGIYRSYEGRARTVDRFAKELLGRKATSREMPTWADITRRYGDEGGRRIVMMSADYLSKAGKRY